MVSATANRHGLVADLDEHIKFEGSGSGVRKEYCLDSTRIDQSTRCLSIPLSLSIEVVRREADSTDRFTDLFEKFQ